MVDLGDLAGEAALPTERQWRMYRPHRKTMNKKELSEAIKSGALPTPPASMQKKRNTCDLCDTPTVLRFYHIKLWICADCASTIDTIESWHTEAAKIPSQMIFMPTDTEPEIGYDDNCGMKSECEFIAELALAILGDPDFEQIAIRLALIELFCSIRDSKAKRTNPATKSLKTPILTMADLEAKWHAGHRNAEGKAWNRDVRPHVRELAMRSII